MRSGCGAGGLAGKRLPPARGLTRFFAPDGKVGTGRKLIERGIGNPLGGIEIAALNQPARGLAIGEQNQRRARCRIRSIELIQPTLQCLLQVGPAAQVALPQPIHRRLDAAQIRPHRSGFEAVHFCIEEQKIESVLRPQVFQHRLLRRLRLGLVVATSLHQTFPHIPLSAMRAALPVDLGGVLLTILFNARLAFAGSLTSNADLGGLIDDQYNSWDSKLGLTVATADFQSITFAPPASCPAAYSGGGTVCVPPTDTTSFAGMASARQADGSLPVLPFLRLAAGSPAIDKGTTDLPYIQSQTPSP